MRNLSLFTNRKENIIMNGIYDLRIDLDRLKHFEEK